MWFAKYEDDFTREYSRLHPEIQKRTDDGIIYLQNAIDPARCGDPKKGWLKGWRSYEIGRQYRIIYKVDYGTKTVILASVGKHKEVYHKIILTPATSNGCELERTGSTEIFCPQP